MVLQHGLGALRDPPTRERAAAISEGLFNKINNISLVSQVSSLMIGYIVEVHSVQSFSLYVELVIINSQLIRNFPLGSLSQVSLLKSLLLFTVLHISAALSMVKV